MTRDAVAHGPPSFPTMATTTVSERSIARSRSTAPPTWNSKDLGMRLGVDFASAATAGALTCPLITVIDRAIIEKASKGFPIRQTITSCLRSMITRPSSFFLSTPFILIYTLYSSTYLTANTIDTVTSTLRNQSYSTVTPGPAKFIATTIVNMAICLYKDARFAKIFGAQSSPSSARQASLFSSYSYIYNFPQTALRPPPPQHKRPHSTAPPPAPTSTSGTGTAGTTAPRIPKISYTLFCLRDSITIFASFNIPALIAPSIPDSIASSPAMKAATAQFACPALMQFASTPMHLLGLDLYNRQPPGGLRWTDRAARIRRDYVPACFARMGKIVPAYGIGGVVNVRMRAELMGWLEKKD